jgi:hypothetical protein
MFATLLAHQAYCALPDFGRKLDLFLVHGTTLSNVGASTKSGVIQRREMETFKADTVSAGSKGCCRSLAAPVISSGEAFSKTHRMYRLEKSQHAQLIYAVYSLKRPTPD